MSGPPQALFVSYSAAFGGAEQILLDRAVALPGGSALACPEGPLAERARTAGLQVHPLRQRRLEARHTTRDRVAAPVRQLGQARELRPIVRTTAPRCVVANSMRALLSAVPALAGSRTPLVFAHNDLLPGGAARRAVRLAARRADHTVALSHAIARDLAPGGPVTVIHPGVDLRRFAPTPLLAGDPHVLMLGALVDWKRPALSLEAVARAATDHPGLHVTVAGAPIADSGRELETALHRRAEQPDLAGRVRFAGRLDDTAAALAGAHCLVHGADREPFGLALVEALASGRPVVAADCAGPAEIVDQTCGRLFTPGDPEAAGRALSAALSSAPALARGARERAERLFDERNSSRAFAEVVAEVAR